MERAARRRAARYEFATPERECRAAAGRRLKLWGAAGGDLWYVDGLARRCRLLPASFVSGRFVLPPRRAPRDLIRGRLAQARTRGPTAPCC